MRTELNVKGDILALRLDQKSFFNSIVDHSSGWDYERYEYFGEKIITSSILKKYIWNVMLLKVL